jgi:hypothetical protein
MPQNNITRFFNAKWNDVTSFFFVEFIIDETSSFNWKKMLTLKKSPIIYKHYYIENITL